MQNINKFTEVYIFVPSITIRRKLPYMESRVKEIDYLKCIFITLMIIFHLVYIGDKYPYAKQIVYTFHMSAFLIIRAIWPITGRMPEAFSASFYGFSFRMPAWRRPIR